MPRIARMLKSMAWGVVTGGMCTLGVWFVWSRRPEADAVTWALIFVSMTLIASAAWGVWAAGRRRDVNRLAASMSIEGAESDAGSRPSNYSWWLAPLAEAVARSRQEVAARADALTSRLREAEIRLSIAEADRKRGEAILHSLRDAVIVTDSFNELALANAAAEKLLGFDADKMAHRPIDELIKDESLRRMIKEAGQSGVVSRQRRLEHSMPAIAGGNQPASFDVTIACLPSPGDTDHKEVGGVMTILRDVTKEKEISQMKSDFVSQASHELRTPIASINAYVEMLLDSEARDEAARQEFYNIIKAEAERISRMIDNMLNISRIEAGIVSVERSEVDFAKVIRDVIETMKPQAAAKNIMLIEKIGPLIYTAEADHDMIHQAILNLVSNAVKYTPDGGRVTVSVENDDATRSVLVAVQDTGLGIPPESVDRIFSKFFRIEAYKRMAKGTGLGLNLVKHIVETVHHGQVGVSSQVGMGSRFWFTVPYEFQS